MPVTESNDAETTAKQPNNTSAVKTWLESEGFPFEMEVANRFALKKFDVAQSVYYVDPDTQKSREIDLTATLTRSDDHTRLMVTFIVECKFSKAKPWILLLPTQRSPFQSRSLTSFNTAANPEGASVLSNTFLIKGLPKVGIVNGPEIRAYSAISAFRGKGATTDEAYAGPVSVARATRVVTGKTPAPPFSIEQLIANKPTIAIWISLIVLDGPLFTAELENSGLQVTQASMGRLFLRNPQIGSDETVVDVVTSGELDRYIEAVSSEANILLAAVSARPELATNQFLGFKSLLDSTKPPK